MTAQQSNTRYADACLLSLHRRWWTVTLIYSLSLGLCFTLLVEAWSLTSAQRWVTGVAGALAYELWILRRGLHHNRPSEDAPLLPTFGAGTRLTLMRGLAIGLLAGFLFLPKPDGFLAWAPAFFYTVVAALDYFDGYVARLTRRVTMLGATLDMEFDGLGMLIAVALAISYGQLPVWYIVIGLARYLFVLGLWWHKRQVRPVYDLTPSRHRRFLAGLQMGYMSVVLWPLFSPALTTLVGVLFAAPLLAGFIRDWLVVTGRLNPSSPGYIYVRSKVLQIMWWIPVPLRIIIVIVMITMLPNLGRELLWSTPSVALLGSVAAISLILVTLGVLARVATVGLLAFTGMVILFDGYQHYNVLLFMALSGVLLLGSGALSLASFEKCLNIESVCGPYSAPQESEQPVLEKIRRGSARYLLWLASLLLVVWLLQTVSVRDVWQVLSRLELSHVLALILANSLVLITLNGRWWLILRAQGYTIPFFALLGYRLAAFGVSYFTPGPQFGGEPLQVHLVRKHHRISAPSAIAGVTLDKLVELIVNFAWLAVGVVFIVWGHILPQATNPLFSIAPLLLLAGPLTILFTLSKGLAPLSTLLQGVEQLLKTRWPMAEQAASVHKIRNTVLASETEAATLCREYPLMLLLLFLVSVVGWGVLVSEYWLTTRFLGLNLTPVQVVGTLTAARLAILLPLPGGLGVLEGSQALALGLFGLDPSAGIGLGLLIRTRDVLLGGLGLWWGGIKG